MADDKTEGLLIFGEQSRSNQVETTNCRKNIPPVKVAMIGLRGVADGLGGVETAVREISVRLAAAGMDITCFCRSNYNRDSELGEIRLKNINAPTFTHTETAIYALKSSIRATFNSYDIIHFHALTSSMMAWIPLVCSDKKIVATIHGLDWRRDKWGPLARAVLLRGEWCAVNLPHCTICVSNSTRKYLSHKYPNRHFECIPNGCTSPPSNPGPPEEFPDGDYILFMGRLVPEKGVHRLIEAYRKIDTKTKLVVAGGDGHCSSYGRKLRKLSNGDRRIIFTGMITGKRKEAFLANAKLFVLPSTLEGHPIALIEACARGICPLVSQIPEATEILGPAALPGKNIFDPLSVAEIARSLEYYLNNPQKAEKLGGLASRHVMENYSWDMTADSTLEIYLRLMGHRP